MKKIILLFGLTFILKNISAQIEVAKFLGENNDEYPVSFGAFLKFSKPVSDASFITGEVSVNYFPEKETGGSLGIVVVPIKIGYRYTINGSGTGFYLEPQVGYNFFGAYSTFEFDKKVKGFVWAGGLGYLFQPGNKIQFDIGLRYESILFNDTPVNFVALRLAHNFTFGRRE
ncbi:MAG TPA: hypothetical protein VFV31_13780 [Chitinophagaceae bacterium]|nr:hypothetical protein [Chitinophagaceae bacterium]